MCGCEWISWKPALDPDLGWRRAPGQGNAAPGNGISGDLIVLIEEQVHEQFIREGQHLHYDLYISFSEAALEVAKGVALLEGKVRIKLEVPDHEWLSGCKPYSTSAVGQDSSVTDLVVQQLH